MDTFDYGGLRGIYSTHAPSLGGNVDCGDPFTHAPRVWDYLVSRFAVKSVLDVGAGQGHAAAYFHRVHGCAVVALEGLADNFARAVYPLVIHDLRTGPFVTAVDLVHCVETVEHVEPEYVDHVIATLATGRVIAMTHAVPYQPGYNHVNCQEAPYWTSLLEARGYILASEDTKRVRALAERDGAVWFVNTGMVFLKSG